MIRVDLINFPDFMKLFTAPQIREIDEYTIKNEPIASIDLMERAAQRCVEWICVKYSKTSKILVVCGQGNNGGDGLAIARLLKDRDYNITCLVANLHDKGSPDFEINHNKLFDVKLVSEQRKLFDFLGYDIIVDALFGSGLSRPIDQPIMPMIESINNSSALVISIDMPSGLYCDQANSPSDIIVEADYTLSLETIKRSQLFPMNHRFVGNLILLPIGLHPAIKKKLETDFHYLSKSDVKALIQNRDSYAHKGNFGHVLLFAGSKGKMGAAVLAAKACLRSGVGLLTMHVPVSGCDILQQSVPEAMVVCNDEENFLSDKLEVVTDKYTVGVGPGIGQDPQTHQFLKRLFSYNQAMVIDADAINILSRHPDWFNYLPHGCILTPHPKELERLVGKWKDDFEKIETVRQFCSLYSCSIIIKGAHTCIVESNGKVTFNSTGNSGMATAGSGDVLTGIITSLIAQRYSSSDACKIGVYIHGLAGDIAATQKGEISMIASDIIDNLSNAFKEVTHEK